MRSAEKSNKYQLKKYWENRTKKHSWMINELLELCDERRRLKYIKNNSTDNAQEY